MITLAQPSRRRRRRRRRRRGAVIERERRNFQPRGRSCPASFSDGSRDRQDFAYHRCQPAFRRRRVSAISRSVDAASICAARWRFQPGITDGDFIRREIENFRRYEGCSVKWLGRDRDIAGLNIPVSALRARISLLDEGAISALRQR